MIKKKQKQPICFFALLCLILFHLLLFPMFLYSFLFLFISFFSFIFYFFHCFFTLYFLFLFHPLFFQTQVERKDVSPLGPHTFIISTLKGFRGVFQPHKCQLNILYLYIIDFLLINIILM